MIGWGLGYGGAELIGNREGLNSNGQFVLEPDTDYSKYYSWCSTSYVGQPYTD